MIQECVQIIFRKACGNNGEAMWSSTRHTCLSNVCVCFTFSEYYGKNHVSLLFWNIHLITRLIVVNSHGIVFLNVMLSKVDEFDLFQRQSDGKAGSFSFQLLLLCWTYDYNKHIFPFQTEPVNNKYTTVSHVVKSAAIDKRCPIVTKL